MEETMNWTTCVLAAVLGATIACAGLNPGSEPRPVGTTGNASGPESVPPAAERNEVPVGQQLDVRLQSSLSSATADIEDHFEATTVVDLMQGDRVLIPAGSPVRGVVRSVDSAGRLDRTGSLTVAFDQITVRGRRYPIRALATDIFKSELEGEAPRVAAGAGVGAIVGGILGGLEGVLAGVLIGAGGTIAATEGKEVVLPAGTVVRIRFDSALELTGARDS
jgi:hypothetical protein